MNGPKRIFNIPKASPGRQIKKLEEVLGGKVKSDEKLEESALGVLPLIKQADNARLLPKYTAILEKSREDGVCMDDLDPLQQDLEKLLSTSAVRIRHLLSEFVEIGKNEDGHDKKAPDKTSLKRKRPDEKPRLGDMKNGFRVVKKHYGLPITKFIGDSPVPQEIPKVSLPKTDNSDKFWASIEPFCRNVTKDDVAFLDTLLQEFSKEIDIKIPEAGEHYANSWSEDIINDEQSLGKSPSKKNMNIDIKKNGLHAMVEAFSTPQTQRCLAALTEESVLNPLPKNGEYGNSIKKLKASVFTKLKASTGGQRLGTCLDRRPDELIEQGILSLEDLTKNAPDNEILTEIKKCQQELATVNEYNLDEISKLKNVVVSDLQTNALKGHLEKVDKQVLDLYNKIMVARITAQEGSLFSDQAIREFENQADSLLRQQSELTQEINGLNDMQMLY